MILYATKLKIYSNIYQLRASHKMIISRENDFGKCEIINKSMIQIKIGIQIKNNVI